MNMNILPIIDTECWKESIQNNDLIQILDNNRIESKAKYEND